MVKFTDIDSYVSWFEQAGWTSAMAAVRLFTIQFNFSEFEGKVFFHHRPHNLPENKRNFTAIRCVELKSGQLVYFPLHFGEWNSTEICHYYSLINAYMAQQPIYVYIWKFSSVYLFILQNSLLAIILHFIDRWEKFIRVLFTYPYQM